MLVGGRMCKTVSQNSKSNQHVPVWSNINDSSTDDYNYYNDNDNNYSSNDDDDVVVDVLCSVLLHVNPDHRSKCK